MDERDEKLMSAPIPEFDAVAALSQFRQRIESERVAPAAGGTDLMGLLAQLVSRPWSRPLAAAVGAIVVVLALTVTGIADTILTIFEPQQIATVNVDPSQLSGIPDPSQYGTLTWIQKPSSRQVADAAAATADAGFVPLVPASLPAGVPDRVRFAVIAEARATFQFDESKARAAAAKVGAQLPPMPAFIAATTLAMAGGPVIVQQYGGTGGSHDVPLPYSDPRMDTTRGANSLSGPQLVLVQSRAPVVTSNGATVNELRDYALAQPGVPPSLAAQIRAIGDPVRTLMVPIGVDTQQARAVTIRGTQGYLVGDQTGIGSGVFWLERGYVIAAFGSLKESDLLAFANALH